MDLALSRLASLRANLTDPEARESARRRALGQQAFQAFEAQVEFQTDHGPLIDIIRRGVDSDTEREEVVQSSKSVTASPPRYFAPVFKAHARETTGAVDAREQERAVAGASEPPAGGHEFIDADDAVAEQQRARVSRFNALRIRKAAEVAQRAAQSAARKAGAAAANARGAQTRDVFPVGPASTESRPAVVSVHVPPNSSSAALTTHESAPTRRVHYAPASYDGEDDCEAAFIDSDVLSAVRSRSVVSAVAAAAIDNAAAQARLTQRALSRGAAAEPTVASSRSRPARSSAVDAGAAMVAAIPRASSACAPRVSSGPGVSNRIRIVNALRHVCLAGAHCGKELSAALSAMGVSGMEDDGDCGGPDDDKSSYLIMLAAPDSLQYRALYRWLPRVGSCQKIHGSRFAPHDLSAVMETAMAGPPQPPASSRKENTVAAAASGRLQRPQPPPQQWAVSATWKYVSGSRGFVQLATSSPGLTTDAFCLMSVRPL
jgi:hypothetical protein